MANLVGAGERDTYHRDPQELLRTEEGAGNHVDEGLSRKRHRKPSVVISMGIALGTCPVHTRSLWLADTG